MLTRIHSFDKCFLFVGVTSHCPDSEDRAVCRGQSSLPSGVTALTKGTDTTLGGTSYGSGSGTQGDDDRTWQWDIWEGFSREQGISAEGKHDKAMQPHNRLSREHAGMTKRSSALDQGQEGSYCRVMREDKEMGRSAST